MGICAICYLGYTQMKHDLRPGSLATGPVAIPGTMSGLISGGRGQGPPGK